MMNLDILIRQRQRGDDNNINTKQNKNNFLKLGNKQVQSQQWLVHNWTININALDLTTLSLRG